MAYVYCFTDSRGKVSTAATLTGTVKPNLTGALRLFSFENGTEGWVPGSITSDFIAACLPDMTASLLGDKAVIVVFDNSKIKRFVPDFCVITQFVQNPADTGLFRRGPNPATD